MIVEDGRAPLFVTRFSLSGKTAIGVQTSRFIRDVPGARHVFWEDSALKTPPPRSYRLERAIPARLGIFRRRGLFKRGAEAVGISRWHDDRPCRTLARTIRQIGERSSVLYLAPLDSSDATRMRRIAELTGLPFVLHLWDMLSGEPGADDDLAWLVSQARATFCLTREMADALDTHNAQLLPFSRDQTSIRAAPPMPGSSLRIALIGDVASYQNGLRILIDAADGLAEQGYTVVLVYLGFPAVARRLPVDLKLRLQCLGFVPDNDARDAALASCHIAFMPGPHESPETNMRSRFSVPSRLLDFGAVALPVAGVVHARSAAAGFASELRGTMCQPDAARLAQCLRELCNEEQWLQASAASLRYFERVDAYQPTKTMAKFLQSIAS